MSSPVRHIPGRVVKYWTEDEVTTLLQEIEGKKTLKEIATSHSRTESSVIEKLKKIALKLSEDGKTMEETMLLTSLTKKQIEEVKLKHRTNLQAKILVQQARLDGLSK